LWGEIEQTLEGLEGLGSNANWLLSCTVQQMSPSLTSHSVAVLLLLLLALLLCC
jgi:hypothetical protein